ncbi:hypothetical protein B795N_02240 [Marinilactibacillus psychrotolerans]|nr:hypothetical protein B795N_02240 [Marinilactibacillus psychrotolerans]
MRASIFSMKLNKYINKYIYKIVRVLIDIFERRTLFGYERAVIRRKSERTL